MVSSIMTKKKVSSWPPSELEEPVLEVTSGRYEPLPDLPQYKFYKLQRAFDKINEKLTPAEAKEYLGDIADAVSELSDLCNIDFLTSLPNKRSFMKNMRREFLSARRSPRHPIAYIMVDIDHFTGLNEDYGHIVGDVCLRLLGHVFREHEYFPSGKSSTGLVRESDFVGRYGGEEFSILLSKVSSAKAAYDVAERIRCTLEARTRNKKWLRKALNQLNVRMPGLKRLNGASTKFYLGGHFDQFDEREKDPTEIQLDFREFPSYTVSIGVCFYDPAVEPAAVVKDTLLIAADKCLYKSKENGRNQVTMWDGSLEKILKDKDEENAQLDENLNS